MYFKKESKIKFILIILFSSLLVFSIGVIGLRIPEYASERESVERAMEVARGEEGREVVKEDAKEIPPDTNPLPANKDFELLTSMDIKNLQSENPDVIGWILIPGTEVSYPLLQAKDNEYYLKHTWDNQKNSCGSIFYDYRSSPNDWNSVIYGHNMRNGSMFAQLHQYKDSDFSINNSHLLILCNGEVKEYMFVAAFEAKLDGAPYIFGDVSKAEKNEFVKTLSEKSGKNVSANSSFVTLSTCTGLGHKTRWVVIFSADNQQPLANTVYLSEKDVTT